MMKHDGIHLFIFVQQYKRTDLLGKPDIYVAHTKYYSKQTFLTLKQNFDVNYAAYMHCIGPIELASSDWSKVVSNS